MDGRAQSRMAGSVRAVLAAAGMAVIVAGCGMLSQRTPAPTPADFGGIATDIGKRQITIDHVVSGDPGCNDQALARTAISFQASGADQSTPVKVYLFLFADRETFDRLRPAIDVCARSFVTDPQTFASIDAPPFVLAGQGPWAPEFGSRLRAALLEAASKGG